MKNENKNKLKKNRILIISLVFLFISGYVMFEYFVLAAVKGESLKKEALKQWTKSYQITNERGEILDRDGVKLAVNIPSFTIWINPEAYKDNNSKESFITNISNILELEEKFILEAVQGERRKKIVQWASKEQVESLKEIKDMKGLEIEEKYKRFYPDGKIYNHIIGFTDIDSKGLNGVELTMNDKLFGEPERIIKMTDARNYVLPFENIQKYGGSNHGDVVLTISDKIQRIAEQECMRALEENKAKSVSVIVVDPNNGDILAMADSNRYDINNPREPIDDKQREEWQGKTDEEMVVEWQKNWNNLNVNVLYEPGSTFKTVTLAGAIEEGVVDDSTELYCNGAITDIPGVVLKCVRWQNPHGQLDITNAYSESCNVAFVQIARKLGRERFLKYIEAFGFGEKSGIEINGEQKGLIPNSISDMTPVTLATASYGQGLAATNLQIAMATAAAVNGGYLLKPRLVKEIRSKGEVVERYPVEIRRKVISKFTSDKMREIMEYTVTNSNKQGQVEGYRVGGKSGTAMIPENGKYMQNKYFSSFVGVAPIDEPKLLVLAAVEEPGIGISFGGAIAGPISSRIMKEALPIIGVKPSQDIAVVKNVQAYMPDVIGKQLSEAGALLRENNIKFYVKESDINEHSIVVGSNPESGSLMDLSQVVELNLENIPEEKLVPNFNGLSKEEALKLGKERGIIVHLSGEGKCVKQSVEPNKLITEKMVIDLNFE